MEIINNIGKTIGAVFNHVVSKFTKVIAQNRCSQTNVLVKITQSFRCFNKIFKKRSPEVVENKISSDNIQNGITPITENFINKLVEKKSALTLYDIPGLNEEEIGILFKKKILSEKKCDDKLAKEIRENLVKICARVTSEKLYKKKETQLVETINNVLEFLTKKEILDETQYEALLTTVNKNLALFREKEEILDETQYEALLTTVNENLALFREKEEILHKINDLKQNYENLKFSLEKAETEKDKLLGFLEEVKNESKINDLKQYYKDLKLVETEKDKFLGFLEEVKNESKINDLKQNYENLKFSLEIVETEKDKFLGFLEEVKNESRINNVKQYYKDLKFSLEIVNKDLNTLDNLLKFLNCENKEEVLRKINECNEDLKLGDEEMGLLKTMKKQGGDLSEERLNAFKQGSEDFKKWCEGELNIHVNILRKNLVLQDILEPGLDFQDLKEIFKINTQNLRLLNSYCESLKRVEESNVYYKDVLNSSIPDIVNKLFSKEGDPLSFYDVACMKNKISLILIFREKYKGLKLDALSLDKLAAICMSVSNAVYNNESISELNKVWLNVIIDTLLENPNVQLIENLCEILKIPKYLREFTPESINIDENTIEQIKGKALFKINDLDALNAYIKSEKHSDIVINFFAEQFKIKDSNKLKEYIEFKGKGTDNAANNEILSYLSGEKTLKDIDTSSLKDNDVAFLRNEVKLGNIENLDLGHLKRFFNIKDQEEILLQSYVKNLKASFEKAKTLKNTTDEYLPLTSAFLDKSKNDIAHYFKVKKYSEGDSKPLMKLYEKELNSSISDTLNKLFKEDSKPLTLYDVASFGSPISLKMIFNKKYKGLLLSENDIDKLVAICKNVGEAIFNVGTETLLSPLINKLLENPSTALIEKIQESLQDINLSSIDSAENFVKNYFYSRTDVDYSGDFITPNINVEKLSDFLQENAGNAHVLSIALKSLFKTMGGYDRSINERIDEIVKNPEMFKNGLYSEKFLSLIKGNFGKSYFSGDLLKSNDIARLIMTIVLGRRIKEDNLFEFQSIEEISDKFFIDLLGMMLKNEDLKNLAQAQDKNQFENVPIIELFKRIQPNLNQQNENELNTFLAFVKINKDVHEITSKFNQYMLESDRKKANDIFQSVIAQNKEVVNPEKIESAVKEVNKLSSEFQKNFFWLSYSERFKIAKEINKLEKYLYDRPNVEKQSATKEIPYPHWKFVNKATKPNEN